MPPKQTQAARAKKLQQKGLALERRAEYLTVTAALKDHYELVVEMKKRMVDLGILLHTGEPNPDYTAPPQLGAAKKDGEDGSSGGGPTDRADEETSMVVLHRNFSTWGAIPPKYVKWILGKAEEVAMSKYAMRAITAPGAKEPPKEQLLHLLEFISGISKDQMIGDSRELGALAEFVCRKNREGGRRLKDSALPVEWDTKGFYIIMGGKDGSHMKLREQYADEEVLLDIDLGEAVWPRVENNWSKSGAMVCYTRADGMLEQSPAMQFFADAGLGRSVKKRRVEVTPDIVQATPTKAALPPIADAETPATKTTAGIRSPPAASSSPLEAEAPPEAPKQVSRKRFVVKAKASAVRTASGKIRGGLLGKYGRELVARATASSGSASGSAEPAGAPPAAPDVGPAFDEEGFQPPEE